jgi:hypothetical protein
MLRIRKKIILSKGQKKKLVFNDIYYDTSEYALTKNDIWLRSRNGNFELEIPIRGSGRYNKIKGEEKIRQIFNIVPRKSFLEDIQTFGYGSFCEIENAKKEDFSIERKEIIEYLKQKRPDHYQELIKAGVVIE